jgi:hypothetical protein
MKRKSPFELEKPVAKTIGLLILGAYEENE